MECSIQRSLMSLSLCLPSEVTLIDTTAPQHQTASCFPWGSSEVASALYIKQITVAFGSSSVRTQTEAKAGVEKKPIIPTMTECTVTVTMMMVMAF